jgi:hypothetical protein
MAIFIPLRLQSGKFCDLRTAALCDCADHVIVLRFLQAGKPLPEDEILEPDEADRLAEMLKGAATAARQEKIDAFLKRFDAWEGVVSGTAPQPDIRSGGGRSCGTASIGMMKREIKLMWKHLDDGAKARIRRYFAVNESYDPPLVNM